MRTGGLHVKEVFDRKCAKEQAAERDGGMARATLRAERWRDRIFILRSATGGSQSRLSLRACARFELAAGREGAKLMATLLAPRPVMSAIKPRLLYANRTQGEFRDD